MDKISKEQRSRIMSKIHGKDTKPEIKLRKLLWNKGYRYRKNYKLLEGTPDIVLIKYRIAIFIDGEFWHGYHWRTLKNKIGSNRGYWIPKIERNIKKDREVNEVLKSKGWKVLRFWTKKILKEPEICMEEIIKEILGGKK